MARLEARITFVFCLLAVGAGSAFPPLQGRDEHGDPLPPGVRARLGTVQLRAGINSLTWARDGRTLIGIETGPAGWAMHQWDAATGRLLESSTPRAAISPRVLRFEASGPLLLLAGQALQAWEVPSLARQELPPSLLRGPLLDASISPDGKVAVLARQDPSILTPKNPGAFQIPGLRVELTTLPDDKSRTLFKEAAASLHLAGSPDGRLVAISTDRAVSVWDLAKATRVWQKTDYNAEEIRWTSDGRFLIAAPGGGQRQWQIWEASTGRDTRELVAPPADYAWMFALSPDDRYLVYPTEKDYVVWDMKLGKVLHRWPGANQWGRAVFAPDGKSVVTYDTILRRFRLSDGKNVYPDMSPLGHTGKVLRILYTPDGSRLISVAEDRTARVWNICSSRLERTIPLGDSSIDVWIISPDGKDLVGIDGRSTVHRWPLDGSPPRTIELREVSRLGFAWNIRDAALLDDNLLFALGWPKQPDYRLGASAFSTWDLKTGRLVRWGEDPGREYRGDEARLSPDGEWAAMRDAVYDTRLAGRRPLPASPIGAGGTPAFSPDGRLIASPGGGVRVWERATGRVLIDLPRRAGASDQLAFSHDSRLLASTTADGISVHDLIANREIAFWPAPPLTRSVPGWLTGGLAFAPDGRTIATGHADGTILLRSIPEIVEHEPWTPGDVPFLWADLADDQATPAHAAIHRLAEQPADALRLLREKYPLVPPAADGELPRLLDALDSPRFVERERATKRLSELGRAAFLPLKDALRAEPSAEQVRRIELLLAELEPRADRPRGDDLRAVRAVAVVEVCATAEALGLLKDWAERGPTPRLADEAARAHRRLARHIRTD